MFIDLCSLIYLKNIYRKFALCQTQGQSLVDHDEPALASKTWVRHGGRGPPIAGSVSSFICAHSLSLSGSQLFPISFLPSTPVHSHFIFAFLVYPLPSPQHTELVWYTRKYIQSLHCKVPASSWGFPSSLEGYTVDEVLGFSSTSTLICGGWWLRDACKLSRRWWR